MEANLQYFPPLIINLIRYFLIAGIPFLIFYILFPQVFSKNKIQHRLAGNKDFIREILHSMQTTLILAGVGLLILYSPFGAYTQVYKEVGAYPLWWIPVSLLLALLVHDTYFYWMHRIIHHPRLFRHVHLIHHKSVNPSPWASYSFHILEGILEAMIAPLILVLIPMHPIALLLFSTISFVMNVYGHLGYEVAPRWFRHSFLFEIMNTSVHHNIHHKKFKGNYGLYFRVWDRWMNTEHPDYVKEYDIIQTKRFGVEEKMDKKTFNQTILPMILLFGLGMGILSLSAQELSIEGKWKDDTLGGVVEIYQDGDKYVGQLIAADKPEEHAQIQGKTIMVLTDFEQTSDSTFCCGTMFQPRRKIYLAGEIVLEDPETLIIHAKYGIFSGKRIWTRR